MQAAHTLGFSRAAYPRKNQPKDIKSSDMSRVCFLQGTHKTVADETVTHRSQWLNIKKQVNPVPVKNLTIIRLYNFIALGLGS